MLFLKEFCQFSQTLQPQSRESFYKTLSNLGVLPGNLVCLSSVSVKTLTITVPWRSWDNTAVPGERDEGSVRGHSSFHRRLLAFPGENYEWPPLANIFHGSFMTLLRCENTWCSRSTPQTTTVSSWTLLLRGWSVTQVGKSARHKFTHLVSNEEKSLATICNNRHSFSSPGHLYHDYQHSVRTPDMGAAVQLMGIIRTLLDPENMLAR